MANLDFESAALDANSTPTGSVGPVRPSRRSGPIRDLLATLAVFVAIELVLRTFGFGFKPPSRETRLYETDALANANKHGEIAERHAGLYWAWLPGSSGEYDIDEAGFFGPAPTFAPPDNAHRIICMGDSTVALGRIPYPRRLQRVLNEASPGRFEVINAGAPGYTMAQAVRLFEGRLIHYAPDLITVQYGWSDQWLSDRPLSRRLSQTEPRSTDMRERLRELRFYQFVEYAKSAVLPREDPSATQPVHGLGNSYQVPPAEYRQYLERIVSFGQQHGVRVALLTAPSNFDLRNPEPFERLGYRPSNPEPKWRPDDLIATHARLNDIVRDVAKSTDAILVDLDAAFIGVSPRDTYFNGDGIHPAEIGKQLIADVIAAKVLEAFPDWPRRKPKSESTPRLAHFTIEDPRVLLRGFWPMEAISRDVEGYAAAIRAQGEVTVIGVRPGQYAPELHFSREDAGSRLRVSGANGEFEDVVIDARGSAVLKGRYASNVHGVLRIMLDSSPDPRRGTSDHGPALIAFDLTG